MSKNYYEELIEKIELLISNDKTDDALTLIKEEMKMPYIPSIYEEKLLNYLHKYDKNDEDKSNFIFSKDEMITMMNEYKKYDIDFLISISNGFSEYNWKTYEQDIQNIFSINNIPSYIKCAIYNSLVMSNMDHDFKINDLNLNPAKDKSVFETDFAIINFNNIRNKNLNDPSLSSITERILFLYLMNTFPKSIKSEYKDISNELVNIAKVMVGINKEELLNENEMKLFKIIKCN